MNSFTRAVNAESDKPKSSRGSSRSCCHELHQSVLHFLPANYEFIRDFGACMCLFFKGTL